ncbi:MAG: Nif3-like dinuclear metal center hexameric protein, partial [Pseudohongiellaceae bacterium]
MSVSLDKLMQQLNELLKPQEFSDYCPNGLQVEGKKEIRKLVSGVTACQQLLDRAIAAGADAILVHHGYFWRGEDQQVTGIRKNRIKTLLDNDVSLIAYHLPLDAHPSLGNNVQLGKRLGFSVHGELDPGNKSRVGVLGSLEKPLGGGELAKHIA